MIAKIAMHRVCVHASILEWTRVRRDGPRAARARQDLCVRYPRAPPSSILSVFSCPPGSEGPIASCSTGVSLSQFVCRVRLHGGAPKPLAPCTSHPQRFQFDTPNLNTLTVSSDASEIRDKKKARLPQHSVMPPTGCQRRACVCERSARPHRIRITRFRASRCTPSATALSCGYLGPSSQAQG